MKILGLAVHDAGKEELILAAMGRSQNIVYINVHKQIYARPKGAIDIPISSSGGAAGLMSPTSSSQANTQMAAGQGTGDEDFAAALMS
jgi:hypothetical protein